MSLPLRKCGLKSISSVTDRSVNTVTSLAEVWIEISCKVATERVSIVTSLAEVWIEICIITITYSKYKSLPLRKCGLKFVLPVRVSKLLVTSLAEVWIEIAVRYLPLSQVLVTSLAEVWIEISFFQCKKGTGAVTSLAEVWIEICMDRHLFVQ